ncbi:MAG: hypothetical protein JRJ29_01520 [Deltaproteobacteria bacterium]|nr:hypothetical protein [Deltaproteobacteria bacterium]
MNIDDIRRQVREGTIKVGPQGIEGDRRPRGVKVPKEPFRGKIEEVRKRLRETSNALVRTQPQLPARGIKVPKEPFRATIEEIRRQLRQGQDKPDAPKPSQRGVNVPKEPFRVNSS